MVQEFDVVVTGLRGQKAIEIEGPTGSVPWALGLEATDDDDEAFQQVVEDVAAILSDQIADAGRSLDSIPSGTTAGTLQVNNIGAWEFTPDLPERQFGDLQPQTGGQATFGDDDDPLDASRQATEEAISNQTAQDRAAERDREQMDLFTAGETDRFDAPERNRDRDPSDAGRGEARSGSEALGGQSALDEFAADRQAASEAVQEKGITGENMAPESVREVAADTPGEDIPDDAGDPSDEQPIERIVYADDRGTGRDALFFRQIGIDDSTIDALVSIIEDTLDAPLEAFEDGIALGAARITAEGDRVLGFEKDVDPTTEDALAREAGGRGTPDVPDPDTPPDGWRYTPRESAGEQRDNWETTTEFRDTPVARLRIQDAGGEPSITLGTLNPDSLRQGRVVYNSDPQKLSKDIRRSIMRPVNSREQALFRAFDAMRDFDAEQYREQAFGQEVDGFRDTSGRGFSVGDVVDIPYESNRGGGSDSISGRIVSFDLPDAVGIVLTQDRVWDASRGEVRIDGTKVGNTDHGGDAITIVQSEADADGGGDTAGMDGRLDQLSDRVSEVVDGYGDRTSADATVSRAFRDAGLDASKWSERQSQDVFRYGIDADDILSRWRDEFAADPETDVDDMGRYIAVLLDTLEQIIDENTGDDTGANGGDDGPPDAGPAASAAGGTALAEATGPLDLEPAEYPEPGEFSLRERTRDTVVWQRRRETTPQREGISQGGGTVERNVASREQIVVRTLIDTGWQLRRRKEVFKDGSFEVQGAARTISEVGSESFGAAVEMAVDQMEDRTGEPIMLLPAGPEFEPDEQTFDDFGGA